MSEFICKHLQASNNCQNFIFTSICKRVISNGIIFRSIGKRITTVANSFRTIYKPVIAVRISFRSICKRVIHVGINGASCLWLQPLPIVYVICFFRNFYNVDIFYNVMVYTLFTNAPVCLAAKTNFPILLALK